MKKRLGVDGPITGLMLLMVVSWAGAGSGVTLAARHIAFVQTPASTASSANIGLQNTLLSDSYRRDMRIVLAQLSDVAATQQIATKGFVCATDPAFSYDGTRLVFSGAKSEGEPLRIWELVVGAGEPREVVGVGGACVTPRYLPNGAVFFASDSAGEYEEHGGRLSFSLYVVEPGADRPSRLTFNPSSDFDPSLLPDGRIVFTSWQHVGRRYWPRGITALMLINSDGTGLFPLTGNHRGPWLKRAATAFGEDQIAFIQADRFAEFGAGTLVATDLNDAFSDYESLLDGARWQVSDVAALPEGGLIVSARPTDRSAATFGLYRYAGGKMRLLYDDPQQHELAPAVGGKRPPPQQRISTVVPGTPFGYVAILNCYETDRTDQHPLPKGSIGSVRVIEGIPLRMDPSRSAEGAEFLTVPGREDEPLVRPDSASGFIPARILGEVPPAADGSVWFKVPADRPLRIQLLDRDGFSIISERAWFWVRPNERRVCIGCHENRELAPNNVQPLAVRREPTDLTNPSTWETVTFRKDIQPILTANCAVSDCHVPPTPTAGMNLTAYRLNGSKDAVLADRFGPAYANLLARQDGKPFGIGGRRVHPGDARSSPMLWMLYGRALAAQYEPAPFERPMLSAHPGPMLPESYLALIRKWVDLGAPYDEVSPPGPWPYTIPPVDTVVLEGKFDAK